MLFEKGDFLLTIPFKLIFNTNLRQIEIQINTYFLESNGFRITNKNDQNSSSEELDVYFERI
jgi:hypothetical protein